MPNKKKGYRRHSALEPHEAPKCRAFKKRMQWIDEQMEAAMDAASQGTVSINKAADLHGVPLSMFKDSLSSSVAH